MRTTDFRWSQVRVGLFVAIGGVILFAAVFYFGLSGSPLARWGTLHAQFDNVFGLAEGSPVEMGGVVVGQIESIGLPSVQNGLVPVTLEVKPRALERLGASSVAFASSHAIVGQRFIGLTTRRPDEKPLPNGGTIRTRPSEAMDSLIDQATKTLAQVNGIAIDLRQASGTLVRMTDDLQAGHGTLGKLLKDEALYDDLAATAANAKAFTDKAARGPGLLATLVGDRRLARDMKEGVGAAAETMKGVRDGKGILGRLTSDGHDAQRLDQTLANLDAVSTRLTDAKGTLGALINDPALLAKVNGLIGQMDSLVTDVRRNPQRYLKISAF